MDEFDIAIIGGGLAGRLAALDAAAKGWSVAFLAPELATKDERTTALMSESIALLDRLGVWEGLKEKSAALSTMRIIDGTSRLFRAPTVDFHSSEIGLEAFGYNIPNTPLLEATASRIAEQPLITLFESVLADANDEGARISITLAEGTKIAAKAVLAADGKGSKTREKAGITVRSWPYNQTAVVLNFRHTLPHRNISTEFHTEEGPFTMVPLPARPGHPNRSSLVWAMQPEKVDGVMALAESELSLAIESRMRSVLGKVEVEPGMQAWPMSSMIARQFAAGRIFLVGETAHAFPPIGAQGLNLSLRDIEQAIAAIDAAGGPARADRAANSYDRARRSDISGRTYGVDLLNRTLLSSFLPAQILRAGGLAALGAIKPLKIFAMREGMTPGWRSGGRISDGPLGFPFAKMLREKIAR